MTFELAGAGRVSASFVGRLPRLKSELPLESEEDTAGMNAGQRSQYIGELEERMREAAKKFEPAAQFQDRIMALKDLDKVSV